ncbi:MAG TPA: zinc ribbon domain-containing protein [Pyrinomonadaceae bacterium]|nr:zinc ribbon domain-containing protein [Pyrinomonadaceae bacterium]
MAETLVEQRVCAKCGADVRKDALFCYHCGGAVEAEVAVSATNGDSVSSGWFRENIAAEEPKTTTKLDAPVAEKTDKPISKPSDLRLETAIEKPAGEIFDAPFEAANEAPIVKTAELPKVETKIEKSPEKPKEETKLKSAAAMRRKAKIVEKKRIEEYEWEEHENAPNLWFILVALILIAIAGGLFFLAVYVK